MGDVSVKCGAAEERSLGDPSGPWALLLSSATLGSLSLPREAHLSLTFLFPLLMVLI